MSENEVYESHRMDESTPEVEETGGKTELEYIWDNIIVNALKYAPRDTAGEVANVAEIAIKKEIDGLLYDTVRRNVANAIGDAIKEVKEHFMEIVDETKCEEKE